jgi:hypothetical protein
MKRSYLISILYIILLNTFIFSSLFSQIKNIIIVKVGDSIITSIDLQNEIITNLIINNREINQENINNNKNFSLKSLVNKTIKKNEIKKYGISNYSKIDLEKYIENVTKNLNTNKNGLKQIFKNSNADYSIFVEKRIVDLLWNTLIFQLYKNQTNINIVEVENEVKKINQNKTEEELKKIRKIILNKKKEEKFQLFSRSHLSNLENTVGIDFQ